MPGDRYIVTVRSAAVDHPKNLADPAFEPTDEDLIGLAERAFAHVRQAREESLKRLDAEIATAQEAAMERFRQRRALKKAGP